MGSEAAKHKRPSIECKIRNGTLAERKIFEKYHYLDHTHRKPFSEKDIYILEYKGEPIGFCSVQHYPHPINKKLKKIHRLVIRPDYQGLGIGIRFLEEVCDIYYKRGYDIRITTSSLSLLYGLKKRSNWICTYYDKGGSMDGVSKKSVKLRNNLRKTCSKDRYISTFKYTPKENA